METQRINVKSIKLYKSENENGTFYDVAITTKESVEGYARKEDGTYERCLVNTISLHRQEFTTEVCAANEFLKIYRDCRESGFDQKALGVLFTGATLDVVRTHHSEGEEILDSDGNTIKNDKDETLTYSRDCFTTNIVSVSLSKLAEAMLQKYLENAL